MIIKLQDMTHVVGKTKAELLSMAKLQLENKKREVLAVQF